MKHVLFLTFLLSINIIKSYDVKIHIYDYCNGLPYVQVIVINIDLSSIMESTVYLSSDTSRIKFICEPFSLRGVSSFAECNRESKESSTAIEEGVYKNGYLSYGGNTYSATELIAKRGETEAFVYKYFSTKNRILYTESPTFSNYVATFKVHMSETSGKNYFYLWPWTKAAIDPNTQAQETLYQSEISCSYDSENLIYICHFQYTENDKRESFKIYHGYNCKYNYMATINIPDERTWIYKYEIPSIKTYYIEKGYIFSFLTEKISINKGNTEIIFHDELENSAELKAICRYNSTKNMKANITCQIQENGLYNVNYKLASNIKCIQIDNICIYFDNYKLKLDVKKIDFDYYYSDIYIDKSKCYKEDSGKAGQIYFGIKCNYTLPIHLCIDNKNFSGLKLEDDDYNNFIRLMLRGNISSYVGKKEIFVESPCFNVICFYLFFEDIENIEGPINKLEKYPLIFKDKTGKEYNIYNIYFTTTKEDLKNQNSILKVSLICLIIEIIFLL